MTIITRFAPSPTGNLHIGGARTALFNALYAKAMGGKYLLRIEDTDRARSTQESVDALLKGLDWLGLLGDAPAVYQSQNAARHIAVAQEMLDRGTAFKCYCTPEALAERHAQAELALANSRDQSLSEADRIKARDEANALLAAFRSPWRDGGAPPADGTPFTVRLRAPDTGKITIDDAVQGEISINADEIDDLILLRADASPTYMLAVAVDDHDMGITHVIRGDDHLRNAFRQVPIFQGMGWTPPKFAHVPLIHGPDGKKLSKRHGATSAIEYKDLGYTPDGLRAYLLRLGWSHGDQEIFTQSQAETLFNITGIGKSPARLDFDKLNHINNHFLQTMADETLLDLTVPFLEADSPLEPEQRQRISLALPKLAERSASLVELANNCAFLRTTLPLTYNKNARKALKGEKLDVLAGIRTHLETWEDWSSSGTNTAIARFLADQDVQIGKVGPPLRAALTGGLPAPDLNLLLSWFGKEEALLRINSAVKSAKANQGV